MLPKGDVMNENVYFLKVGENYWINPFPGNIVYAEITKDFDGNKVIEIHFVGGQVIRWGYQSLEARVFMTWLNNQSISAEKQNEALANIAAENQAWAGS